MTTRNGKNVFCAWSIRSIQMLTYAEQDTDPMILSSLRQRHIIAGKAPKGFFYFCCNVRVLLGVDKENQPVYHYERDVGIPGKTLEEAASNMQAAIEDTQERVKKRVSEEQAKANAPQIIAAPAGYKEPPAPTPDSSSGPFKMS